MAPTAARLALKASRAASVAVHAAGDHAWPLLPQAARAFPRGCAAPSLPSWQPRQLRPDAEPLDGMRSLGAVNATIDSADAADVADVSDAAGGPSRRDDMTFARYRHDDVTTWRCDDVTT